MTPAAQRTVARNDPCPCRSGRRYKDCHGSLRAQAPGVASVTFPRTSQYRPAGDDWAALDEGDRDRLGALMERALAEQTAGRVREAERLYRAVLEEAAATHDALHMLGVVRLGLGDYTDAERLIGRAMALRPEYPAIVTNWLLVRRSIAARDRRGVEILSEHALPLLFASLRPSQPSERAGTAAARQGALDVAGSALDVTGDGAWLMRRLQALLAGLQPRFWNAPQNGQDGAWQRLDALRIDSPAGRRPRTGNLVLTGIDADTDGWLREPIERVLVFMQPAQPSMYLERLRHIAADGARSLTLVFDSQARARRFGEGHHVLAPPIDVAEWRPAARAPYGTDRDILRVATVGQDRRRVLPAQDADHLRDVAQCAGRLDVFDPGPLRYALGTSRFVVCVPHDANGDAACLRASDVYLQRILPWWSEAPRTLFGAMLLGVPVLCPRASMYSEYVTDGVDGWLYDVHADALRIVGTLRNDRARVDAAGRAARANALARFAPHVLASAYTQLLGEWMQAR